ncbi:MAG: response regulator [Anaerolineae bacterium]
MKTDVLFIHRQLAFAVSIKQALERTGNYDVHPFTSVEAAMEYLRGHPQDVALVDFMMPVYSGEEVLVRLREAQPQITVVATPVQTEDEFSRLGLNGMLAAGFTAREFIPAIERALEGRRTGELPKRGTGLLGRVQEEGEDTEKRPPTSTIGYRSLESILDEGAGGGQPGQPPPGEDGTLIGGFAAVPPPEPEPMPDMPTLIEGLPVATDADDLSFLDDILSPASSPPPPSVPETDGLGVVTDRLSEAEMAFGTEPLGITTEPLAPIDPESTRDDIFAGFDPEAFAAEYGTRPLSEIEAEEAASRLAEPRSSEFEPPEFALPDLAADDEDESQANFDLFADAQPVFPPQFEEPAFETSEQFEPVDEEAQSSESVDYMAYLNLRPSEPPASAAPPWLADGPVSAPAGPSEDEVVAGLQALFASDEPAAESSEPDFSFAEFEPEPPPRNEFEDLLNELSPPSGGLRQRNQSEFDDLLSELSPQDEATSRRSEFDEMVASMGTPEARAPLPTRQQQYVDVTLTDDMSSLVEQIEQARTSTLRSDMASPGNDEAVDLSSVLFVDDEDSGDTPSTPAEPVDEPALASSEELAALFGTSRRAPAATAYDDFEALMAASQAEQPVDAAGFESLFVEELSPEVAPAPADQDFEAFMASFESGAAGDTDSIEFEVEEESPDAGDAAFAAALAVTTLEEPPAEPDLESLFQSVSPFEERQPNFTVMFDEVPEAEVVSAPEPELDLFSGDWGEGDVLALDQEPRLFEDTGTVSDLMTGVEEVTGTTGRTGMLTHLTGPLPPIAPDRPDRPSMDTAPAPPPIDDTVTALLAEIELQLAAAPPPASGIERSGVEDTDDTPARRILETTNEAEQTDSSFSLDHLIANIEAQLPPDRARVQPLPSWVRPPSTLPESVPEMSFGEETVLHTPPDAAEETLFHVAPVEAEPAFDWDAASFDDTTALGAAARAEQTLFTGDEETSWLEFIEPEPGLAAETVVAGVAAAGVAAAVQPTPSDDDWAAVEEEAAASARAMQSEHIDDPYVAQLALSLTDVSLELTADAILLTRGRDIAAFAGRMSRDELLELRQVIDDDWEAAANDARIRFLRLPESGKDVMLYSRHTVEDLTLSLVFDGAMPLRDIRLQGKRLMDALATVPETPVEIVLPPQPDVEEVAPEDELAIPRSPHAFVWLLRDPEATLARPVAQAIVTGLNQQMTEHGWRVREMKAIEDHVYLLADSPDEQPPYVAVRELMRRSAQIAYVQNPSLDARALWADAYLVVTPGRSLEADEIQQFIQFERML